MILESVLTAKGKKCRFALLEQERVKDGTYRDSEVWWFRKGSGVRSRMKVCELLGIRLATVMYTSAPERWIVTTWLHTADDADTSVLTSKSLTGNLE